MSMARLSLSRWVGIMLKEFIQLKRDRLTFGMIVGIPVLQLILFGYAINSDPKRLPTAVLAADHGMYERTLLWALKNSGYFRIEREAPSEKDAQEMLARGEVQFVITVPENFSRRIARGERPALLVEADATDPSAIGNAIAALGGIARSALARHGEAGHQDHRHGEDHPEQPRHDVVLGDPFGVVAPVNPQLHRVGGRIEPA